MKIVKSKKIAGVLIVLHLFIAVPVHAAAMPNDPLFAEQQYLQAIKAPSAWERTTGSRDIIVAIIDSGVDEDHEDLIDNIWTNLGEIDGDGIDNDHNGYIDDIHGWDFSLNIPSPNPKFQSAEEVRARPKGAHHGTIIAGLIGAIGNNGKGIVGVNWQVTIMPIRALSSSGLGSIVDVARAIDYARTNGADVINMSFNIQVKSDLLTAALKRAYDAGVVVVTAAGNDDARDEGVDLDVEPSFPVCAKGPGGEDLVLGVAALDDVGRKSSFSYFGNRCVDIAAPGERMVSTQVHSPRFGFTDFYSRGWSGTSFATALVSGAAALIKSVNPSFSVRDVQAILAASASSLTTTEPAFAARLGAGALDVAHAIAIAEDPFAVAEARAHLMETYTPLPRIAMSFMDGAHTSTVAIMDIEGRRLRAWSPYDARYRGSVLLASGDLDHDGVSELAAVPGKGGGPHVRFFAESGSLIGQFFAYEAEYRGGIRLAIGDVNPAGASEVIVIPEEGRRLETRVFAPDGARQVTAFPFGENVVHGGDVAAGDVTGDGIDDIVYVSFGVHPRVVATDVLGNELFSHDIFSDDDAGEVSIALADTDADGVKEIVVARGQGKPIVRIFKDGLLQKEFLAYAPSFRYGVRIAAGDIDLDGDDEIVTVPRAVGGPHVRIFHGDGTLHSQFFAREKSWRGSMDIAVIP